MPQPLAPQISQRQYDDAARRGTTMRDAWRSYIPQMTMQQGLDFAPQYGEAAAGVAGDVSGLAGKTGFMGDISGMVSGAGGRLGLAGMRRGMESEMDAFGRNRATMTRGAMRGWDKGNKLMDTSYRLSQLPQESQLAWAQEQDSEMQMRRANQPPMNPWGQVTSGIGGMVGRGLGNYVYGQIRPDQWQSRFPMGTPDYDAMRLIGMGRR